MAENPLRRLRRRVSRSLLREELDRQHDLLEEEVEAMQNRLAATQQESTERTASELAYVHAELERLEGVVLRPPWANLIGGPLRKLDPYTAAFLNYATGEYGYAAQAGVWFAPVVSLVHGEGAVELGLVDARIVEQPFAQRCLAGQPAGAAILDVGATGSSLAYSLAAWDYEVTALDPAPYPLAHPRLTAVTTRVEEWDPLAASFQGIVALAVFEHAGFVEFAEEPEADLEGMRRLRLAAAPGAVLVVSVPVGAPAAQWGSRVYDRARLEALLDGWRTEEAHLLTQTDTGWAVGPLPPDELPAGRVLVRASAS